MTPDGAFLEAIVAAPDDDAPRSAYADVLCARGDPRGDFIRMQLRHARAPETPGLSSAIDALRRQHGDAWAPPIQGMRVTAFRRGFAEAIELDAERFVDCAEEIFAQLPVRDVTLRDAGDVLVRVATMPELERVRRLAVSGVTDGDLEMFAISPYLEALAALELGGNGVGEASVQAIVDESWAESLVELSLSENPIGDDGVGLLATSRHLGALQRLDLGGCGIGADGATHLLASPVGARLTHLRLAKNPVHGLALPEAPTSLRALDLAACALTDDDAHALAAASCFPALDQLDLSSNAIGARGAEALRRRYPRGLTSP